MPRIRQQLPWRPRRRLRLALPILLALAVGLSEDADAQSIEDNFEAGTLEPGWLLVQQQFGTISLSTDQNHTASGSQSLKLASTSGGQRYMIARRYLGAQTKGTASIYFYDAAPGQETLYVSFALHNSTSNVSAVLGTQDFDAFCYKATMAFPESGVNFGPNANCGIYPRAETTNVPRTLGWHRLSIEVLNRSVVFSIDSTTVYTYEGDFSFDMIQLDLSGPFWRPDTVAYFDDFTFAPNAVCDIQLSQALYTDGQMVTAPVFRIAINTTQSLATEIKVWLGVPGIPPVSIVNAGSDGSLVLPGGFDVDLGPLALFEVSPAFPRGGYEFSCRMLDPTTGAALWTSLNAFVVQ